MKMRYFKLSDFDCKHTGRNEMNHDFLAKLDQLRHACGFPFIITSGYRDKTHPVEARKAKPGTGTHAQGIAADIRVSDGAQAYIIMREAFKMGFTGIARGATFVHVDMRKTTPVNWVY